MDKLRQRYRRLEQRVRRLYANSIAPRQSERFLERFLTSNSVTNAEDDDLPSEIQILCLIYDNSNNIAKSIILSVIDHSKYTKEFLICAFNCTKLTRPGI